MVISIKHFDINGKYSITHQYDAGPTSEIYPGVPSKGLVAHGIQGFDYERARADLGIPDIFDLWQ